MLPKRTWRTVLLAPCWCAKFACRSDRPTLASTTGGNLPPPAGVRVITDPSLCQPGQLGPTALRRLSRNEYNNMVGAAGNPINVVDPGALQNVSTRTSGR
jgi:hypothetical protein